MLIGILLFVWFGVFAMLFMESMWSNTITLFNVVIAAFLALGLFEPAATLLDDKWDTYTYLWDFLMFWLMFCICFGLLRLATDFLSRTRVKFRPPIELPGRYLMALTVGFVMVALVAFSVHISPLPSLPFMGGIGVSPTQKSLSVLSPEGGFISLYKMVSAGSLSRGHIEGQPPSSRDVNQFDPQGEFVLKYRQRRRDYDKIETLGAGVAP